jgi:hypothetical protein
VILCFQSVDAFQKTTINADGSLSDTEPNTDHNRRWLCAATLSTLQKVEAVLRCRARLSLAAGKGVTGRTRRIAARCRSPVPLYLVCDDRWLPRFHAFGITVFRIRFGAIDTDQNSYSLDPTWRYHCAFKIGNLQPFKSAGHAVSSLEILL